MTRIYEDNCDVNQKAQKKWRDGFRLKKRRREKWRGDRKTGLK